MSSLSTLPKGDSAWLLRKAIERIMEQVSVLETNIGSSTTGNSANTQIIFNDNGTLRGDTGLVFNKTTDALTVAGLVTAGSATITGALTVDTSTLKVDSTNNRVGIGTASPAYTLDVIGTASIGGTGSAFTRFTSNGGLTASGVGAYVSVQGSGNPSTGSGIELNGGATPFVLAYNRDGSAYLPLTIDGSSVLFKTSGSTKATIDSSGNVGVGVTPSAWYSPYSVLQVGIGASISSYNSTYYDNIQLACNYFANSSGADRYINNGYATQYFQYSGSHIFRIAGNNTSGANQALTWTQAMTLDASGRLFVGATAITAGYSGNNYLIVGGVASPTIKLQSTTGPNAWDIYTSNGADLFVAKNSSDLGSFNSTTGIYTPLSDANKKRDFEPSNIGLAEVLQLQPKLFRMVDDADDAPKTLGFVAQDVKNIIPQAYVEQSGQNKKFIGLQDRPIIAALTRAIQELTARVQTLEAR